MAFRNSSISSSENSGPSRRRLHLVVNVVGRAGVALDLMPDQERRAERAAGVAGRGLNPDVFERPLAQEAAVRDAVQRDAARHAEIFLAGKLVRVARHLQDDLLGHHLDRPRDVHLALGDFRFRLPRRAAEQRR